jgi:diguanylate cyclase (GGDEF)-like protein
MRNRHFLMMIGALVGFAFPFGRLLWRAYETRRAWWHSWLSSEFQHHASPYICLGVVAVVAFGILGYVMGLQSDREVEESENVLDTNTELSQQASTDSLTGLFNPRAVHERLDIELENCFRSSLTCLVFDIDHFKRINDTYGHPFGDTVLIAIARVLKQAVRRIDVIGRIGGEEFIIILPGMAADGAVAVGERVRLAIEQEPIAFEGKRVHVTVSVGLATYPSNGIRGKEELLKAADDALYQAKRSGRNRLISAA